MYSDYIYTVIEWAEITSNVGYFTVQSGDWHVHKMFKENI